jgi:signal transduction histidine kinase/ActR/RegA family two-component response regulator
MVGIGVVLNIIGASMRTEELLEELQHSNTELEAQAKELEEKAKLLQIKNQEVELASLSLEEKAEQLALISKYKSEFLANMSHELRTPLNSLLIMAKLLADNKDGNLTLKQIEFANTIQGSGRDLLSLINEILDLSKVEAGKMAVTPAETALTQVLDYVERDFRPVAQQKNIAFTVDLTSAVPATLYTDGQRLQQILKNLLSNAFKFTEEGNISITVKLADPGQRFNNETLKHARKVLAFIVSDTGIGIAENKQRLIFEAFQQVDATTSRKYGGTGLGLTISREIARLLGGEIHVQSTPGKGSTFALFMPETYIGAEAEPKHDGAEEQDLSSTVEEAADMKIEFNGEKILVVDDDVRNIFAITSMLENQKLRVVFAENGRDAIDTLKQTPDIDLVLLDIMMPEMDGYETARAIRVFPKYSQLPIIALTAKAMKGDREKCLEAGASDYIIKPVDTDKLLSLVKAWLHKTQVH